MLIVGLLTKVNYLINWLNYIQGIQENRESAQWSYSAAIFSYQNLPYLERPYIRTLK